MKHKCSNCSKTNVTLYVINLLDDMDEETGEEVIACGECISPAPKPASTATN